jgi:putative FmdB family regulatory protein
VPIYEYNCTNCTKLTESLEPMDTKSITCECGKTANRIISSFSWKFADHKDGKWCGDTSKIKW